MSRATEQVQEHLQRLGFPLRIDGHKGAATRQAIKDFKRGYNLEEKQGWFPVIDAFTGKRFHDSLEKSLANGGKCSQHFTYQEFKSHGNGWIRVNRELLFGLERYRKQFGPVSVLSPYRDPSHNVAVGGATFSQHTDVVYNGKVYFGGNACDFGNPKATLPQVMNLKVFSGIGTSKSSGLVKHVDVRHAKGGFNTTNGTPAAPTCWLYP